MTALHPEHLADLRKSGLSDETIAELGIHSARPGDIPKLLGFDPSGVQSVLVFPYHGADGFFRAKVFPPFQNKEGHSAKYLQRPNSGVHFYLPSLASNKAKDPTAPLAWTEGEKKAAKACQEGIPCVGLGGLWNWLEAGAPVAELDGIAHAEREELLLPDSDIWSRPDLLRAVYALGKEIEERGAKVQVGIIPPGPDGAKWGLDDFLVHKGPEALREIKRLPLKHSAFSQAAKWWKGWKEKKGAASEPPDALKLLEKVGPRRSVHPAQDFTGGMFFYGIRAKDSLLLITSCRKPLRGDELPEDIVLEDRGFDLCRFSKEGILSFLKGANIQGHKLLLDLKSFFERFVIFRDNRTGLLLAVWTLATYCYCLFRVFPYLLFRSPVKRCGKSRAEDSLSLLAFNATSRTTNPTEAQLFRGPAKNGGTLLLDEVENLRGDKEAFSGLLSVLNSGFENGGTVTRLQKSGEDFKEVTFGTYCPRALAGISRLAETLEDRSIIVFMARKLKSEKVERFSPRRLEVEAQKLRDGCYTWTLTHAGDLATLYEEGEFPELEGLDDRARDLWEPLLAIARQADQEAGSPGDFASTLAGLAKDLSGIRGEGDTNTVGLLEALEEIVKETVRDTFTPKELLALLKAKEGFDWLKSTKALAGLLNPVGFLSHSAKVLVDGQRKSERHYKLSKAALEDLSSRYGDDQKEDEEECDEGWDEGQES